MDSTRGNARPVDLLLEAFRQGRPGAFDAIVRAHQDRVFAFCARMLSDREEALDVAQEVFLSAYRNLVGFREEASLSTWLLKIAANRCLNRIRQRSTRSAREVSTPESAERDGLTYQPPAPEEGQPDRIAETREMGKILEQALHRIDADSRWLMLLSDVEGFTYEEVAAMAGIPVGTVKSRLHRARMALRKILAPVV
ncbi:MAG TPA: sigma-70 family RNA polymerase sigma factor [Candidatus Limnocylindrales bacterium]|nr:sigma-70 family RNA polymerase sigma factor [Candidatus Limnocylindrales bacterium]